MGARGVRGLDALLGHAREGVGAADRSRTARSPGRGRSASRPGDEDLPASPARQAAAVAAAAAGRLHCLTTARARLSLADLQIQATSLWKIRELPPQDQEKKNSMLLYRVPRSKTGCS